MYNTEKITSARTILEAKTLPKKKEPNRYDEVLWQTRLMFQNMKSEKLKPFLVTIIFDPCHEFYDIRNQDKSTSIDHEQMSPFNHEHGTARRMPASAIDGATGDLVCRKLFPKIYDFIFGRKFNDYRVYQPKGIGYYDKPFKGKILDDFDQLVFTGSLTNYVDHPHVHFLLLVKDETPCGIQIMERFEQFFLENQSMVLCGQPVFLHVVPVHTKLGKTEFESLKDVMFYNAKFTLREKEKLDEKAGETSFVYFVPSPPKSQSYKPFRKGKKERAENLIEITTWKKHTNPLTPVKDKITVPRKKIEQCSMAA